MASIGLNLASVTYWGTEEPFIDKFKTSGPWYAGYSGQYAPVDAHGNPTASTNPDGFIWTIVSIDPPADATSDQYVLTYSGTGHIDLTGVQILSSTPGQITFDATNAPSSGLQVKILSDSATDPVHDLHLVRADQVGLYNSGEIFNPAFIDKVSQFGIVRFMDWGNTNSSQPVDWSDRSVPTDATWSSLTASDGVPLDVMVKLANEAHVDMWYNVPTQASDAYVTSALQYIHDNLSPDLKVHVEYSNEMWNWGLDTSHYGLAQAVALWGHDANGDGTIDTSDINELPHNWMEFYGLRSAQIAAIAHQVYGDDAASRLSDVLSGQAAYADLTTYYTVNGVAMANEGSVSSLFSEYAITSYFGSELDGYSAADQATVVSWARSGATGIDTAFREMEYGGLLQNDYSLTAVVSAYAQQQAIAQQYGLDLVAYEGGAHLTAVGFSADVVDEVTAFFTQLMDDPRMGDLYSRMIADFQAAGGDTLIAYNDVGTSDKYGDWGVLSSINDSGSPRYDALVAAAAADRAAAEAPQIGTAGGDVLVASSSGGALAGLAGNDTLTGGSGSDLIDGGDGNDIIHGVSAPVTSSGQTEADYFFGGAGSDTIIGGQGNDHIYGNSSAAVAGAVDGGDSILGGDGNDYVQGNAGADTIDGGSGNDRLYGGADADSISGGTGWDYLQGNKGDDTLRGGDGNDTVHGGANNDQLFGGADADQLFGDDGNDMLTGGTGIDTMTGGAGGDFFIFSGQDAAFAVTGADAWKMDEITDFTDGVDSIKLGFRVEGVVQGAAASVQAALVVGQALLTPHLGHDFVAAVAVGSDTYLFYDGDGLGGAIDSGIKVDHVLASVFQSNGYDFI